MPPLVVLVSLTLVGWPIVKLVATTASRSKWRRQRHLKSVLDNDRKYGALERKIVAEKFEEGKGSVGQLALPFVAFFGGLAAALAFSKKDEPQSESAVAKDAALLRERLVRLEYPTASGVTFELLNDPRFTELSRQAFELEMLRYPVATLMTGIAILPALLLMICVQGLRLSIDVAARAIVESSQETVRLFPALVLRATRSF